MSSVKDVPFSLMPKCSTFQMRSLKSFSVLKHILQKLKNLFIILGGFYERGAMQSFLKWQHCLLDQNKGIVNIHLRENNPIWLCISYVSQENWLQESHFCCNVCSLLHCCFERKQNGHCFVGLVLHCK